MVSACKKKPVVFKTAEDCVSSPDMQPTRRHTAWRSGGSTAAMLAVLLWLGAAAAATPRVKEVHRYRETTGQSVKEIQWQLDKTTPFILVYASPSQRHVTTTDPDYATRRWTVNSADGRTDLCAERDGETIVISGRFEGAPIKKVLKIDDRPWYQATSLSMRGLIASDDSERTFWTIRSDTLTAHKIRAIKKGVETDPSTADGGRQLLHIRLTLPGLLAPFWQSDYWFTLPDGTFYRFEGPSGPPGAPTTTVTRID